MKTILLMWLAASVGCVFGFVLCSILSMNRDDDGRRGGL